MRSCDLPSKSSARVLMPSSVSKLYSFSTRTHGSSRRCRARSSPIRVCSFSRARSASRAANHSSRLATLWSVILSSAELTSPSSDIGPIPNEALCRAKLPPAQGQLTPHSLTLSPLGRGEYSNRQAVERAGGEHRPNRSRSMTVSSLLLRAQLAKRPARLRNQEHRVVAETGDPPPLRDDLAAALALEEFRRPARRGQGNDAHKPRQPRARIALQAIKQHLRALLLGGADASRMNAREALQHLDFDAGVIADRGQSERLARRLRFQLSVLRIGRPHLRDIGVDGHQVQACAGQKLSILAQLARIAGGNDQPALSQARLWLAFARRSGP